MIGHFLNKHGTYNNNMKSYIIGFILSIILTVVPFWLVMYGSYSRDNTICVVFVCAIIQILVHLVCFLHLDNKSEDGWNMIAIIFAIVIVLIIVIGSLWIMWNLNSNIT